MSVLNRTRPTRTRTAPTYEGGLGRTVPAEQELALLSLSTTLGDRFYETSEDVLNRMQELVNSSRPQFVEQLARVARQEFNMRASSAALVAFLTLRNGQPKNDRLIDDVFFRGDEIGDYLAVVERFSNKGKVIPSAVRFARKVINRQLNERKALRYANIGREWSLAKAILLTHARMDADVVGTALMNFVVKWNELGSQTQAWEAISEHDRKLIPYIEKAVSGQDEEGSVSWERERSKGADWTTLIDNMGYMAMLKNLRNFLEDVDAKDTTFWNTVTSRLRDADEVSRSRQFPFRFYSAWKAIEGIGHRQGNAVRAALADAIDHSVGNLPELGDNVLIVVDASGSMTSMGISSNSTVSPLDIGNVLGASLFVANNSDVVHFGTTSHLHTNLNINEGVMGTITKFGAVNRAWDWRETRTTGLNVGHGTNIESVRKAVNPEDYDTIVLLSDMQVADSAARAFSGFKGTLFSVNLNAYQTQIKVHSKVVDVSGWSDSVLKLMSMIKEGSLVDYIMNY